VSARRGPSRRQFLKTSAGLVIGFTVAPKAKNANIETIEYDSLNDQ